MLQVGEDNVSPRGSGQHLERRGPLSTPSLRTASFVYPRVRLLFLQVVWHEVSEVLFQNASAAQSLELGLLTVGFTVA